MTTSRPTSHNDVGDTAGRTALSNAQGLSAGHRIPVPPRERKPALAALAVLLILGGALASAYLVVVSGQRTPVIRVARQVAAGQKVPLSALEEVQVSGADGLDCIPWKDRGQVAATYTTVTLVKGSLLTNNMISRSPVAARGSVVVGLALKPGQLPASGLSAGDRVALYAVAGQGSGGPAAGTVLSSAATVSTVTAAGQNDVQSDQVQVSVAVPAGDAPQVTSAAAAGTVAVALLPPGEQAPQTRPKLNIPSPNSTTPGGH